MKTRKLTTQAEILDLLATGATLAYRIKGVDYVFTEASITPNKLWLVTAKAC